MKHDPSGAYSPPGAHIPERTRVKPVEGRKGEQQWPQNPFWDGFVVETRAKRQRVETEAMALVKVGQGEISGAAEISRIYEVDKEQFVKLFTKHLRVFLDLGQQALKLYPVLLEQVSAQKNTDIIYLSPTVAQKWHRINTGKDFPQASFYRGRKNLIEAGIIAPSLETNLYWINPRLIWNGDRVDFVTSLRPKPQILPPEKGH